MDKVYLNDSDGNVLTRRFELSDSKMGPKVTPEKMIDYIKRAYKYEPLTITIRGGENMELELPLEASDLITFNPELLDIILTTKSTDKKSVG